jgi:hypothetical protein
VAAFTVVSKNERVEKGSEQRTGERVTTVRRISPTSLPSSGSYEHASDLEATVVIVAAKLSREELGPPPSWPSRRTCARTRER